MSEAQTVALTPKPLLGEALLNDPYPIYRRFSVTQIVRQRFEIRA
jgi:hypothetical protein